MSAAGTTTFAAAITCASSGLPPTWCRTLGSLDLSRVPLPAAMMTMAVRVAGSAGPDAASFAACALFLVIAFNIPRRHVRAHRIWIRDSTAYPQTQLSRKLLNYMLFVLCLKVCSIQVINRYYCARFCALW